jgi:hypothetical protein
LGVDAALEAVGSVGVEAMGAGLAADVGRGEEGAFEEDVTGLGADSGLGAAHDAGQGDGLGGVGDHQGAGVQGDGVAIE